MKNKLWGYPHIVQHFMEKVLPVLQMVEEQRKANPPLEISQTTASEISVSSSIPDAHVEMLELIDSSTGHRLKCGHNTVPASSTVEAKLRDRSRHHRTLLLAAVVASMTRILREGRLRARAKR